MGLGIYLILSKLEKKEIETAELELIMFSLFFFLWVQFIFFKDVFIKEGINFVWQNVPPQMIQEYFPQVPILEAILLVSIIPFVSGIFIVYRALFQLKSSNSLLLISLAVSTIILSGLRLIEFTLALEFLGVVLAIFFASFYLDLKDYLEKTKLKRLKKNLLPIIVILLTITMVVPAIFTALQQELPSDADAAAFKWLEENTAKDSRVASLIEEGNLVAYYGQRKNLMDEQFGLIPDTEEKFTDLNSLYVTKFETRAIDVINNYDLRYIMYSEQAQKRYEQEKPDYLSKRCFEKVYDNGAKIYLAKCVLEKTK